MHRTRARRARARELEAMVTVAAAVLVGAATVLPDRAQSATARLAAFVAATTTSPPTTSTTTAPVAPPAAPTPAPRVLLMGDSVMNQQGSHAAFLLEQLGVAVHVEGIWGSGLLTRDQYDFGRTHLDGFWLARAARLVRTFDPQVVVVYLNHNYWPPYPRDPAGHEISDLWTATGQAMVRQQVDALITILRARGAAVYFVAPLPLSRADHGPNQMIANPIWHAYASVLQSRHVGVLDTASAVADAQGVRVETEPSCHGQPERVRPDGDLHLTRYGASLTGTALAREVAGLVHVAIGDDDAPGEHTAALVSDRAGDGYWLVGCDGSVFRFGRVPRVDGARHAVAHHGGVVSAVADATGRGLWLVTADGTIVATGDAPALRLQSRPRSWVRAATASPTGHGLWVVTAAGEIVAAGDAARLASLGAGVAHRPIVDVDATPSGHGLWLTANDGHVFTVGDASFHGSLAWPVPGSVVALAPTHDGRGYWLVGPRGGVAAFGDARALGDGVWQTPPFPYDIFRPPPGPAVSIVSAPGATPGYWIVDDTGRVVARGAAPDAGGTSNLALATQ